MEEKKKTLKEMFLMKIQKSLKKKFFISNLRFMYYLYFVFKNKMMHDY